MNDPNKRAEDPANPQNGNDLDPDKAGKAAVDQVTDENKGNYILDSLDPFQAASR